MELKQIFHFLENVVKHEKFLTGEYDTSLLIQHRNYLYFPERKDRGTKMLTYIGNVTVNGFPGVEKRKSRFLINQKFQN